MNALLNDPTFWTLIAFVIFVVLLFKPVKKALLDSILSVEYNSEIRVNAVAFLLYLCGQAPEPFDWTQRPFFLLFSSSKKDPKMLQHAWEHLRKRTGL